MIKKVRKDYDIGC